MARLALGVLVVVAAVCGYFVHEYWHTLRLFYRMSKLPMKPDEAPKSLAKLVRVLPPSDRYVIFSVPGKMGTTWSGHIAHQLLTHGKDVDVSKNLQWDTPYPEFWPLMTGKELADDGPYWEREPFASYPNGPVTIRTHTPHSELQLMNATEEHGFRIVTVLRDPLDTLVSAWRFLPSTIGINPDLIPIEVFVKVFQLGGMLQTTYNEYVNFWQRRHHMNMHVIFFDDLKKDLRGEVRRLADFLRLSPELTEEEFEKVVSQSTHKFMSSPEIAGRFNDFDATFRQNMLDGLGLTEAEMDVKSVGTVRQGGGKSGEGKDRMPEATKQLLLSKWEEIVLPATGCKDFADMLAKARAERAEKTR